MSITLGVNTKLKVNSIDINWARRPTNVPSLWVPEVWGFGPGGPRLVVNDTVGWKESSEGVRCDAQTVTHEGWSFEWQGRMDAAENRADIEISLSNNGSKPLPDGFRFSACLNFVTAPDFMNSSGSRTFFRTRKGWQNMLPFRRPQSKMRGHDPYHILLEGYEDQTDGEAVTQVRAVSPLCVRVNRTRDACIGYSWQRALRIDINYNRLQCMHSTPNFGSLAPGETSTHRGAILFHEGDKDELLERAVKLDLA